MLDSRRWVRILSAALLAFSTILFSPVGSFASQTRVLFGPEVFTRTGSATDVYTGTFTIPGYVSPPYHLYIRNGNPDGSKRVAIEDAVSSGSVWVNGVKVVAENEFSKAVGYIDKTVDLNLGNTFEIQLNSAPDSYITLTISGVINIGSLSQPRSSHASTLLPDGRVLITGGDNGTGILSSAEIFDPATLSFSLLSNGLTTPRMEHTATLLPDSDALFIAGRDPYGPLFTAEIFNIASGSFTEVTATLTYLRSGHTSTLLPDGRVLIAGGVDASDIPVAGAELFNPMAAILFDPMAGTFKPLSDTLSTPRSEHSATLLPDGRVLIIGGRNSSGALSSVEVFDPAGRSFAPLPAVLNTPRYGHSATLLPDGRVVVLGGGDGISALSTAEVYDPDTGAFSVYPVALSAPRFNHQAILLPYGEILITGGENEAGPLSDAEFFGPPAADIITPGVITTDPSAGATDVSPDTLISVLFSEPVDVTTLSLSTFTLTGPDGAVSGRVTPGESGLLGFFVPASPLAYGTTYTIGLGSGIRDTSGNPLMLYTSIFTTSATPTITGFSPARGPVGTPVTIMGTNFDATATALFNGVQAVINDVTPTLMTATVPAGATTGPITVMTSHGAAVSGADFIVTYPPLITGFSPDKGPVGTPVTITGYYFDRTPTAVTFNGAVATITGLSSNAIATTVPLGATTGPVSVITSEGTATSQTPFTVEARQDFLLSAGPAAAYAIPGRAAYYGVTLASTGPDLFTGLVELTAAGLPEGVSLSFNPAYASIHSGSVLTLATAASMPAGEFDITVRGKTTIEGAGQIRSAQVRLSVLPAGATTLAGRIFTAKEGDPLSGVKVSIGSLITYTDQAGVFFFENPPAGDQIVMIDGAPVSTGEKVYTVVPIPVTIAEGEANELAYTLYLQEQDIEAVTPIDPARTTVVTDPDIPDYQMTIPQGVRIIGWDGQQNTQISVTTTTPDRLPIPPLPDGVGMKTVYLYYFGKAGGGIPERPIPVIYPNDIGALPGQRIELWYYDESKEPDPDSNQWKTYGMGTVTPDGKKIVPDPGVGIPKFCCGSSGPRIPAEVEETNNLYGGQGAVGGDPVNLATGLFVLTKTDMVLPGRLPVAVTRTYRTQSNVAGPFGIGTSMNLDLRLTRVQNTLYYIMPGNSRVLFSQRSDGSFINTTEPDFKGVIITQERDTGVYTMPFKDGTLYRFNSDGRLIGQEDRNRNSITVSRDSSGRIYRISGPDGRALDMAYDSSNRITSVTDPLGREVRYTYNPQGYLDTVTDPAGGQTRYTYDQGRMISITDARGITYLANNYDGNGRVYQQTGPHGEIYTFRYTSIDSTITESSVIDPEGHTTTYRFNNYGYPTEIRDAMGQRTFYERRPFTNELLSVTDPFGRKTTFTYDDKSNVTAITDPEGNTTRFEYEATYSRLTRITDALGNVTQFAYDPNGNLTATADPLGNQTTITYNPNGQPLSVTDPLNNTTTFEYDTHGNLVTTTDSLGNKTRRAYDLASRLTEITDPNGKTTQFGYDALNRVTEITDALGGLTGFAYDPNGNLLTVTDARGNTTSYTYDTMDRLATRTDPLGRSEGYDYDQNGNLNGSIDRKGQTSTFAYDPLNRRTSSTFADGSRTDYAYDIVRRLTSITDTASGAISFAYDSLDRLIQEDTPAGSVSYAYDTIGRRTSMTVSGQQPVTYQYDAASRLTQVTQGTQNVGLAYDASGRRTTLTYPNGTVTSYSYDAASRLTNIVHQGPTALIDSLTYAYDAAGNRISLTRANDPATLLPEVVQAAYDAANEQIQFNSDTPNFTYDANGNLTSHTDTGGTTTYAWNARNHLIAINGPNVTATFKYDSVGRRIEKTVNNQITQYIYDGNDIVQEIENGVVVANYLRGLNIDEAFGMLRQEGTYYYIYDALGSTIDLIDSNGNKVAEYFYDPFGNSTSTNPSFKNPFQYTGRENDNTGLYYYRARYYSPELHRFISEDPIEYLGGDINLYGYVGNNPVNDTDPLGLFNILAGGGFSAAAITGIETSSGFVFNPGLFGQKADIGTFASIGPGVGVNISADLFVGFVKGRIENVQGETANINIVGGLLSVTLFIDPKKGDVVGGTFGVGPGPIPIGASGSHSITRTLTLRELLSRLFGPDGQVLCGRKSL